MGEADVGAVVIVRTGVANTASVRAAIERRGARGIETSDPDVVVSAPAVILPGVGAFGPAMALLERNGLADALRQRFQDGGATLAVCLGLQLLCEESEESPGVRGLGLLPHRVRAFPRGVRVPHFGWNEVRPEDGCRFLHSDEGECHAYFANSFRLGDRPEGWRAAWTEHGGPFIAAIERGRILACQFHPELSGVWGDTLIARWLGAVEAATC